MDIEKIKTNILENNILDENTKRIIIKYCNCKELNTIYMLFYSDVLRFVWTRIINHKNKNKIIKNLNNIIKDDLIKITDKISNLLECLVGYYDDIN